MEGFTVAKTEGPKDVRFDVPLYTVAEAARVLGVAPRTFGNWAKGYERKRRDRRPIAGQPVVTALRTRTRTDPSIPFVGLAEGLVLTAVRRAGVPLQRIRPALAALESEIGLEHALATRSLFTDGAEILYDYGRRSDDPSAAAARQLVVVRSGQHVFSDVVNQYLRRIDYAPDGYARLLRLPAYGNAQVVADPERSFGQPIFLIGAARVSDVLERFWAGDSLESLVEEFGVPLVELEDALRVASRRAA